MVYIFRTVIPLIFACLSLYLKRFPLSLLYRCVFFPLSLYKSKAFPLRGSGWGYSLAVSILYDINFRRQMATGHFSLSLVYLIQDMP
jgi:hypothetical protein